MGSVKSKFLIVTAIALTTFLPNVYANQAFDAANKLPADTLIYVGWSQVIDDDTKTIVNDAIAKLSKLADNTSDRLEIRRAGKFISSIAKGSGGLGLVELSAAEGLPEIHVAAVLDAGDNTIQLGSTMRQLLLPNQNIQPELVVIDGKSFQKYNLEGLPILWGVHDGLLITVAGTGNIEQSAQEILSSNEKLSTNPRFKASRKRCDGKSVPKFCVFADVETCVSTFQTFQADSGMPMPENYEDIKATSGLNSIRSYYMEMCDHELGIATKIHTQLKGPRVGVLKLWDTDPVKIDDLRIIPKNATWSHTRNFDVKEFFDASMVFLGAIDPTIPTQATNALTEMESKLGFSIINDALASFGNTWTAYDSPDHAGFLGSGKVYVVEVTDQKKLEDIANKLIALLNKELVDVGVTLTPMKAEKSGQTINFLVATGFPIPVAPAATFVNNKLVFGIMPYSVAMAAKRIENQKVGDSILDHPNVKTVMKSIPENMIGFYYSDNPRFQEKIFGIEHLLMTAAASYVASETFNPGTLPTMQEAVNSWKPSVSGTTVDDDEIYFSSFGFPLSLVFKDLLSVDQLLLVAPVELLGVQTQSAPLEVELK